MLFLQLPPELLIHVFCYLKGKDIANIAQTCKDFKEISETEVLWQIICLKEYGFKSQDELEFTYREFYQKVLYRYGKLLGVWRNCTTCYGGLVYVSCTSNGYIVASEYCAQQNVRDPLIKNDLFHVRLDVEKNVCTEWLTSYWGIQPCDIFDFSEEEVSASMTLCNKFSVKWEMLHKSAKDEEQEKDDFRLACAARGTVVELCMYKWGTHNQHQFLQHFTSICVPEPIETCKVPLQPGFFKGTYGGHGSEVVMLTYDMNNKRANIMKISGDPNVPAGEISIKVDLLKPMILTSDEQRSVAKLSQISHDPALAIEERSLEQPFVIPSHITVDDEVTYPKYCQARYHSLGTVSPMGYSSPAQINNHFIIFDENLFAVLWLDLHSLSMFSRVTEKFFSYVDRNCNRRK